MKAPSYDEAKLGNERVIGLRGAGADDQSYVCRTWVASVLDGPRMHRPDEVSGVNFMVDRLLDDRATRVLVACEPMDHRRILGFLAYQSFKGGRALLYICVRHQDRKQGIGRELVRRSGLGVNGTPIVYLWDGPAADWARKKRPDAVKVEPKEFLS